MIKLTKSELMELLEEQCVIESSFNAKKYFISASIAVEFDTDNGLVEFVRKGIQIKQREDGEEKEVAVVQTFEQLKEFFGQNQGEDAFFAQTLSGYKTKEEYLDSKEFERASMDYLLEKYSDCDTFALCGFHKGKISQKSANKILEGYNQRTKNYLNKVYEEIKPEYSLEPFEVLYEKISKECQEFEGRNKKKYLKKYGFFSNSFICDHVGKDTVYSQPTSLFWHFYHMLGMGVDNARELELLVKNGKKTHPAKILNSKKYKGLKSDYIGYELTYETHCTSGPLQKQMYFRLTENSKVWLRKHKNDYDFEGALQDLAFYKNGKLRFSSCTHEGFHDDIQK